MKQLLITIAAVVLVGCGESQQSTPSPEVKPAEPVAEVATPKPPTAKALDISIHDAAIEGNIEVVKQHLAAGTDVNVVNYSKETPLHYAAINGHKEIAELLITGGADVNAKKDVGNTPLHTAAYEGQKEIIELLIANGADVNAKSRFGVTPLNAARKQEIADLLRKHGGKTGRELKAEGK